MTRYKRALPETWAEKECITDMITELNKIFDYAQIRKTTREVVQCYCYSKQETKPAAANSSIV